MNKNRVYKPRGRVFHLSQKVDYGLFLLAAMSKSDHKFPISIKCVADQHRMSFYFLQKVARLLKKAGLIEAKRGKMGGYKLTHPPEDISLKEIVEALEGPVAIMSCLQKHTDRRFQCERKYLCPIKSKMTRMNAEIENMLLSKNLQYFIS